jgi:hypothetical protein
LELLQILFHDHYRAALCTLPQHWKILEHGKRLTSSTYSDLMWKLWRRFWRYLLLEIFQLWGWSRACATMSQDSSRFVALMLFSVWRFWFDSVYSSNIFDGATARCDANPNEPDRAF